MATILITGACGLLGAQVALDLLARGDHVVGFDLAPPPSFLSLDEDFAFVTGDIVDAAEVARAINVHGVSRIVHSGGISTPAPSLERPGQTVRMLVEGALAVMDAARLFRLERVVLISSDCVYSRATRAANRVVREDDPTEGDSPYGVAKRTGELLGVQYHQLFGVDVVAVRPTLIFGARRSMAGDPIRVLIERALAGEAVRLPHGGDSLLQAIYVKDCSRAVIAALDVAALPHRVYNVGSGERYSLSDAACAIAKSIPGSIIELGSGEIGDELGDAFVVRPEDGVFSIERIGRDLGWRPRYTLDTAIDDYIADLRDTAVD